jgi:hypothetical protein
LNSRKQQQQAAKACLRGYIERRMAVCQVFAADSFLC